MITVKDITILTQVYDYQMRFSVPFCFSADFESWKRAFLRDVDGEGRTLFRNLAAKAAFDGDTLVGFTQFGNTAFGFDDRGEISGAVSYPVIRSLCFDEGREDAGRLLLQAAMEELGSADKVYAFFHYFGMSCFGRHGKLFEGFPWIGQLLQECGFAVEHENVYYSAALLDESHSDIGIRAHEKTKGSQQTFDFLLEGRQVGSCEVHYLAVDGASYLQWIYVNESLQNQGVGSRCMAALKAWLRGQGVTRLDTDTALDNRQAQRYYEKNGFTRAGITRSYYRIQPTATFVPYSHEYYPQVCDFLIALNREKQHINWNWARWEWMYAHPYCDRGKLSTMGLWVAGDAVVGAAIYDLYPGEGFCAALDGYGFLLPEILAYAYENLRDDSGFGIALREGDTKTQALLESLGYRQTEQTEPMAAIALKDLPSTPLPAGFQLREIRFPEDTMAYQTVIWKGFDHEGDDDELQKMLRNPAVPPNRRPELCLAVTDETGEFAAHCTCWYDSRTDYAYIEPVCTVPKHRHRGLGKAVVLEALRRCKALGAVEAFVLSDQAFYQALGFRPHSRFRLYRKT